MSLWIQTSIDPAMIELEGIILGESERDPFQYESADDENRQISPTPRFRRYTETRI